MSNLDQLRQMRERIASLPEVRAKVAARAAERLSDLARESFDAGRDVVGQTFGVGADGKPLTLVKTGKLREQALDYEAQGTRVRASVASVPYAKYQLKHGFLPAGRTLPAAWDAAVDQIAQEEIAAHIEGAR